MIHRILKLTTEQPRQACFKASYKREKAGGDGRPQPRSSSNRARTLGTGDEEEEEAEAPELVSTC